MKKAIRGLLAFLLGAVSLFVVYDAKVLGNYPQLENWWVFLVMGIGFILYALFFWLFGRSSDKWSR